MRRLGVRIGLLVTVAGLVTAIAVNRERFSFDALDAWLVDLGAWGPLAFVAIYALATLAFVPGSALSLLGGALFGPVGGTLANLVGATLGATAAFAVARTILGDWARARAGRRLDRLLEGIEREGWRFVAFARLVPVLPFNLLNYAFGVTRIGFWPYVAATFVFMLPGAAVYSYLGHAGRAALGGGESAAGKLLLGLGLLAAIAFLPRLVKRWRHGEGGG